MNSPATIEHWVESRKDELMALLPGNIKKERFIRNIIMQVKMNDLLRNCSIQSIAKACVQASTLGLDIGVLGSAYLVPYGSEAQLSIGYQGYIDLAYRSGLKAIHTGIVREGDTCEKTATEFIHKCNPFDEDRGDVVGVYCLVELPTGATYTEAMSFKEIEQIRSQARSGNSPAWRDHWGEMAKKVVIRRALKRAPLSVETKEAIQESDQAEFSTAPPPKEKPTLKKALKQNKQIEAKPVKEEPSIWEEHNARANELASIIGVSRWNKITKQRQAMLTERMKEEGFTVGQVDEFWDKTIEGFTPFKQSMIEGWDSVDLEVFLRIPKKGNPDHYTSAMEGKYRDADKAPKEASFSITNLDEGDEE